MTAEAMNCQCTRGSDEWPLMPSDFFRGAKAVTDRR